MYIKTERGAQVGLGHVARDGWILSLGTPPQPQGGKRQVSLNTRGERRPNRDNRHHLTKVIKGKANQPVFTSQHHNSHARAPVPSTNVGFLWILDHGTLVTHLHFEAGCHLLPTRGDLAAGRSWAGEVAESKGPRLRLRRISPASFSRAAEENPEAGRAAVCVH